jgi:hypothetical protein
MNYAILLVNETTNFNHERNKILFLKVCNFIIAKNGSTSDILVSYNSNILSLFKVSAHTCLTG